MPHRLLAMDPGTYACGVALFVDGKLATAALLRSRAPTLAERGLDMAVQVANFVGAQMVDAFISELPQKYPHDKVDPNDLISLTVIVGVGLMAVAPFLTSVPVLVKPAEWKGQMNKTKVTNLVRLLLAQSEKPPLDAVKWDHNVVEAVGIGLHALKRGWK